MIKFNKGSTPKCLIAKTNGSNPNYKVWAKKWESQLKKSYPNKNWNWYAYKGKPVNTLLIDKLRNKTNDHCSFCDKYAPEADCDSIEHLLPKILFPLKSFSWTNLFLSCVGCQKRPKGWKNHESEIRSILKPDAKSYSFERYFYYDTKTGKIEVKKIGTSKRDQQRAELTIKYFQLNEFKRPASRMSFFKMFYDSTNFERIKNGLQIDELPYRFMFK